MDIKRLFYCVLCGHDSQPIFESQKLLGIKSMY
jgi:hypothetical protein